MTTLTLVRARAATRIALTTALATTLAGLGVLAPRDAFAQTAAPVAAPPPAALPPVPTAAAPAPAPSPRHPALRYDLRYDLPITLTGGAFVVITELTKRYIVTPTCRWCDRDSMGNDTLNGLDAGVRGGRWTDIHTPDTLSNITGFGLTPLFALGGVALSAGIEGGISNFPVDLLVIAEATAVAATLTQIVKFSAMRERPFVHFATLGPGDPGAAHSPSDNNLSFFSGHSSITFSLAVSAGTVATMRGYRLAPMVWALGLTAAASTAYLRIAADKHYMTDVLLGTVIGAGIGFALPYLVHRPTALGAAASSANARTRGLALTGMGYMPLEGGGGLSVSLTL